MKRINGLLLLLFIGLSSCNKDSYLPEPELKPEISSAKSIQSFTFEAKNNSAQLLKDVVCHINDSLIVGLVPYISNDRTLIATFKTDGHDISVDGIKQETGVTRNNYSNPVTFTVKAENGSVKKYTVKLYTFTGLPIIYLETEAPVLSKEESVKGKMQIDANNSGYQQTVTEFQMEMRGRGNTTWGMPKKPYRIKLDKKAEILGMAAAKKWVLLANFSDKTMLRNNIAFELGKRFEAAFTPKSRFVEVVLNGEYLGNYLLTDQVEVGETRVNIPELDEDSPDSDISGGYLLEVDARLDEPYWFITKNNLAFTIKSPEEITSSQFKYISDYVQLAEDAIYGGNFAGPSKGYEEYINVESFINWYLVNELTKNNDAAFFSSVFMHKDRHGKLSLGPIWDFDIALGNVNYNGNNDPQGWWIATSGWMFRLFEDPAFRKRVKARWTVLKTTQVNTIFDFINQQAAYLKLSQRQNFNKWDVLYNYTWPNAVVLGSYDNEVQYMKEWLAKRIAWMDDEFKKMD
ncbi:CotH kinase family protein [Pedobacter sp. JY14-1]|uniref:CotH kinase family protein n=1 Tax=Pedobacter sp. JY14-1 TaxID=3034151 RepID=UPI0023E25406|nr:CotH kinase family protein [Pedobacter sp. JY14-1]